MFIFSHYIFQSGRFVSPHVALFFFPQCMKISGLNKHYWELINEVEIQLTRQKVLVAPRCSESNGSSENLSGKPVIWISKPEGLRENVDDFSFPQMEEKIRNPSQPSYQWQKCGVYLQLAVLFFSSFSPNLQLFPIFHTFPQDSHPCWRPGGCRTFVSLLLPLTSSLHHQL